MGTRPAVGRRAIEVLLQAELPDAGGQRLVLVDATYEGLGQDAEFTLRVADTSRRVRITDQDSRDLRSHAVRHRPLAVDRAEIVKQLFGATDIDPRMAGERWLLDALLEAEPADGWPRAGAVLTRDRAVRTLLAARLGLGDTTTDTLDLDADTLFAWTRTPTGPARYAVPPVVERDGLSDWLLRTVGPAAPTLLALAADGRGADALPLGALASAAALASATPESTGFALGTLFGPALASFDALRPFADAVTGVLTRWIAEAEGHGPQRADTRDRVLDVLDPMGQAAGGQGQHHLVDAGEPALPLLDDLRLEAALRVAGHLEDEPADLGQDGLGRAPLRVLLPTFSCFSWPRWSVISRSRADSRISFVSCWSSPVPPDPARRGCTSSARWFWRCRLERHTAREPGWGAAAQLTGRAV